MLFWIERVRQANNKIEVRDAKEYQEREYRIALNSERVSYVGNPISFAQCGTETSLSLSSQ